MIRTLAILAFLLAAACAEARRPPPPQIAALSPRVEAQQQLDTRPVLRVTKDEARAKAAAAHQGEVTAVDLERKRGRVFWVVEMQTKAGDEIDILVDVESGEVVGVDDVDD